MSPKYGFLDEPRNIALISLFTLLLVAVIYWLLFER